MSKRVLGVGSLSTDISRVLVHALDQALAGHEDGVEVYRMLRGNIKVAIVGLTLDEWEKMQALLERVNMRAELGNAVFQEDIIVDLRDVPQA